MWLIVAGYGVYYAAAEGIAKAFVADLMPSAARGRAYGLYHGLIGLAALPASLVAGFAWETIGPGGPFLLGAGLAAIAGAILAMLPKAQAQS
mgnify:CR=1 FL=1